MEIELEVEATQLHSIGRYVAVLDTFVYKYHNVIIVLYELYRELAVDA